MHLKFHGLVPSCSDLELRTNNKMVVCLISVRFTTKPTLARRKRGEGTHEISL